MNLSTQAISAGAIDIGILVMPDAVGLDTSVLKNDRAEEKRRRAHLERAETAVLA